MKNGSIDDKLKMQEFEIKENISTSENRKELTPDSIQANSVSTNRDGDEIDCSLLSIFSSGSDSFDATLADELHIKRLKKKKKRGLRR